MGSVIVDLVNDLSKGRNIITQYHTDLDGSLYFCSQEIAECHIRADLDDKVGNVHHYSLYNKYNDKKFKTTSINYHMNKGNCLDRNMACEH